MTPGKGLRGGFRHQVLVLEHELVTRLDVVGIVRDALYRADLDALRRVEMPHALGAQGRVDLVVDLAQRDGLVRAHGFADVAVDAGVEDFRDIPVILRPTSAKIRAPQMRRPSSAPAPSIVQRRSGTSAPVGARASATRCWSAWSPMNRTMTFLNEPAFASLKASTMRSAVLAESGPPKASILPGVTPRATVPWTFSSWRARPCLASVGRRRPARSTGTAGRPSCPACSCARSGRSTGSRPWYRSGWSAWQRRLPACVAA